MYKTLFLKNKIRCWLSALFFSVMVGLLLFGLYRLVQAGQPPWRLLAAAMRTVYYIFLFFLFISFDFAYSLFHSEARELLTALPGGLLAIYRHIKNTILPFFLVLIYHAFSIYIMENTAQYFGWICFLSYFGLKAWRICCCILWCIVFAGLGAYIERKRH